ncbi:MAG: serine hydrolase domain-containing protein [Dokdonella sp.]|uniref:serine hydrolase domain-containing protein n=1 Tax=Dokdonella sp. TaxID=2291710 RepID=UPI003263F7CF
MRGKNLNEGAGGHAEVNTRNADPVVPIERTAVRTAFRRTPWMVAIALSLCACIAHHPSVRPVAPAQIDRIVERQMDGARVPGLAIAVIRDGRIDYLHAYGSRDVQTLRPLQTDTVMYGASLTKAAFAWMVMQLVDEGVIELDRSIAAILPKPLPDYEKYADLAGDERWRMLTPRLLLSHRSGFPNFRFFTANGFDEKGKLYFAFDPGSRYGYSGEGINLLQFVIETGLGLDVGREMQTRVFDRFGMTRTGMLWREDFAGNLATGYDEDGKPIAHRARRGVRAAGSMDTTIADQARMVGGMLAGDGLSADSRAERLRPQARIRSLQQFPTLSERTTTDNDGIALATGLGVIVYDSPLGKAWFKSGHDDGTNNLILAFPEAKAALVMLSNSSNGESVFRALADELLGPTCFPWFWENDIPFDHPEWKTPAALDQPHPPCAALPPLR